MGYQTDSSLKTKHKYKGGRQPLLSIEQLCLRRRSDHVPLLHDVSFSVTGNEVLCLVGESGSGKSITMSAVLGILPKALEIFAGNIYFSKYDLSKMEERELRRIRGHQISMVFQEPMTALNPTHTIGRQIEEMFLLHKKEMNASQRRKRTLDLLHQVKIPSPRTAVSSYPHQLSGGQRQRVMIAIALALNPQIVIADEPTTALDVTTQAEILDLFQEMKQIVKGAIVFITHDFGIVAEIADRVVVMQEGRVVETGPVKAVIHSPQSEYTRSLIKAVPGTAGIGGKARTESGRKSAVVIKGVSKTYRSSQVFGLNRKKTRALININLAIKEGEALAIVGESGSGKTTLAKILMGMESLDTGSVYIDGLNPVTLNRRQRRRLFGKVQMVFQDPASSLNPKRDVGSSIIQGPVNFGLSKKKALEKAARLLEQVKLSPAMLKRFPNQFSGGQRQRICIARALALDPKTLIADEPVSSLDVSVQKQVLELIAAIRRERNLTLLLITHDLRVAAQVCERIIVIKDGRIVEAGNTDALFATPSHPYTKSLLKAVPGQDIFEL